jgi:uncharacterized membrane protein
MLEIAGVGGPSEARAINDVGAVVGVRAVAGGFHAFLAIPVAASVVDLPGLAGGDAEAHDINNAFHIVGTARAANGQFAAVLWTPA